MGSGLDSATSDAPLILVCGEALVDFIPSPPVEPTMFSPRMGGSPYNVAIGLARLQTRTGFLGRLSRDFFGRSLKGRLLANGVEASYLKEGPELSTLAFVEQSGEGEPEYLFYVENSVDRQLGREDIPDTFSEDVRALHFGSISLVLEPGASTLEACMAREHGRRLISLDPNVRPFLIADREAYRKRLEGWLELTDLVKVSRADLSWLYPGESYERVAERWVARGPRLVVVTLGKDGCLGLTPARSVEVPTVVVQVVDTVGAGDSFTSGLLGRLDQRRFLTSAALEELSGAGLQDLLEYASLTGALACARPGAEPPYRAEVEQRLTAGKSSRAGLDPGEASGGTDGE